jgi:hypothetical protein
VLDWTQTLRLSERRPLQFDDTLWTINFRSRRREVVNIGWAQLVCALLFEKEVLSAAFDYYTGEQITHVAVDLRMLAGAIKGFRSKQWLAFTKDLLIDLEKEGFIRKSGWFLDGTAVKYVMSDPAGENGVKCLLKFVPKDLAIMIVGYTDWRYPQVCLSINDEDLATRLELNLFWSKNIQYEDRLVSRESVENVWTHDRPKIPRNRDYGKVFPRAVNGVCKEIEDLDWTQMVCMAMYLGPLINARNREKGTSASWVRKQMEGWCGVPLKYEIVRQSMEDLVREDFLNVHKDVRYKNWDHEVLFVLADPMDDTCYVEFPDVHLPGHVILVILQYLVWERSQLTMPCTQSQVMGFLLKVLVVNVEGNQSTQLFKIHRIGPIKAPLDFCMFSTLIGFGGKLQCPTGLSN